MEWPSWPPHSIDHDLDRLYFTDTPGRPTTPRACQVSQSYQLKDVFPTGSYQPCTVTDREQHAANHPIAIESRTLEEGSLDAWASSPLAPRSGPALLWGFRFLYSFRKPMTEAERSCVAPEDLFDLTSSYDLSYFCVKRDTLKSLITSLKLPERFLTMIRTRGDESMFSFAGNEKWMKYVLRTERYLADDLVLAVHWEESDALVTAFLHGCTEEEATQISKWLDGAKAALKHPLLPALVLAEIQLARHSRNFRRYDGRYVFLFDDIKSRSEKLQTQETNLHDFGGLEIADWLARIFRMYHDQRKFQHLLASFRRNLDCVIEKGDHYCKSSDEFNIVGRLREISLQYEDLRGQSSIMADGASLLLTTLWSLVSQRDNQLAQEANTLNQKIADSSRSIAKATARDSAAMKALAFITMIFLPATGVAAIFSMPIFDWTRYPLSAYVRRSIWIYCIMTCVLTSTVLYVWRFWYLRDIWQRESSDGTQNKEHRTDSNAELPHYPLVDQLLLRGHEKRQRALGKKIESTLEL